MKSMRLLSMLMAGLLCGPGWGASLEAVRSVALTVPSAGAPGFTALEGATTGVTFSNRLSVTLMNRFSNIMNGSGVALGDVDGDGRCDIFLSGLETTNRLYRNLGNWRFEDITAASGVALTNAWCRGAVLSDVDGDGDLDLLLTTFQSGPRYLRNEGGARFVDATEAAGLSGKTSGTTLALADVDGDGDLDLYVANFGDVSVLRDGGTYGVRMVNGQPVVTGRNAARLKIVDGRLFELGEPDVLFRNVGSGRFAAIPWEEGFFDEDGKPMKPPQDFGLDVQMRDLNADGAPDIYVCNDFQTPDRFWINDGKGRFRLIDCLAVRTTSYASMGVDVADVDRDGRFDLFTVEMLSREHPRRMWQMVPSNPVPPAQGRLDDRWQVARNALLWNRGDGTYAEIAQVAGLAASEWSWMPLFLDVDLDGFEDVLVPNGHVHDMNDMDFADWFRAQTRLQPAMRKDVIQFPALDTPNVAFRNLGGLRFEERGKAWGFDSRRYSHGTVTADLDGDGDLDVVINCLNAPALLLRNDCPAPRVAVRLKGISPNVQGIGALIVVQGGAVPQQMQEILSGGRYLSGDDPVRVFAAGASRALTIEVQWRSGRRSVVGDARPNSLYEIAEEHAEMTAPVVPDQVAAPWFEDRSGALAHRHHEDAYDDLVRQPLLPRRMGQLGPGLAWADCDEDGREDLVIGCGRGGMPAVFRNDGAGGWKRMEIASPVASMPGDVLGLASWVATPGRRGVLMACSGSEGAASGLWWLRCSSNAAPVLEPVEGVRFPDAPGPIVVTDVDGDSDLDVFVGGRTVPGRHPEPAASMLMRNDGGALVADPVWNEPFLNVGLVSGAVCTDLDGDGTGELVLACEWGPVRVFRQDRGIYRDVTAALGLAEHTGWWNSVTAADVDGDGRMDLVAGNWGLDSPYQPTPGRPLEVVYGEFRGDGVMHALEGHWDVTMRKVVPFRNLQEVGGVLPEVRARFTSHKAYGQAGLDEILGEAAARARRMQAATLASTVFLNRGDRFEARPLPAEAQWSPCFGLSAADLDGDGDEDLFLAQNFFAFPTDAWRQDAGRGLLLHGDGQGGFAAIRGQESGLKVYGEQRGSAVADWDGDGRVDLVVAQNGNATRLFRNEAARPGLRVRLLGPPGNPDGIGAVIRLRFGDVDGLARERHGGGGYLSQDGAVEVFGTPRAPTQIRVRWPGGRETTTAVPPGAMEVSVGFQP